MVIRTTEHNDPNPVFALQLIEHLAGAFLDAGLIVLQALEAHFDGTIIFFLRQSEQRLPSLQHLVRKELAVGEVQDWIEILHIMLGKDIVFLGESCLHGLRCSSNRGAGVRAHNLHQWRMQHVVHGEEDHVQWFLAVLLLDQVVNVRDADLGGETRIDRATAGTRTIQFGSCVIGVDDVLRLNSEALEITVKQRRVSVDVKHAWYANPQALAILHESDALFGRLRPGSRRDRIGNALRAARAEDFFRSHVHEIWMLILNVVETSLDVLHLVCSLVLAHFAGGNDEALLALHQRHFGDLLDGNKTGVGLRSVRRFDVDKGAETVILAEIAARVLVTRGAVLDLANSFKTYEAGLESVPPQAQRFLRRADCARFATMLVNDDFRTLACCPETAVDEIHFGFDDCKIVLCSSLQHKTRAKCREVGDAGHVQKHVLRQNGCQASEDFFRAPALALKVHDVGLHEHRASVAEHGHGIRGEGQISVLLHFQPKAFRSRLQEVAVPRRALGIELEIFDPAVVQDDQLDILPTHVDNDVRIIVELQSRLGMRNGLNQRDVGLQDILQNVFRVSGGRDTQNFQLGILRLYLAA